MSSSHEVPGAFPYAAAYEAMCGHPEAYDRSALLRPVVIHNGAGLELTFGIYTGYTPLRSIVGERNARRDGN